MWQNCHYVVTRPPSKQQAGHNTENGIAKIQGFADQSAQRAAIRNDTLRCHQLKGEWPTRTRPNLALEALIFVVD